MIWKIFNFLSKRYPIRPDNQAFVILGLQRSGTSMIGQILEGGGVYLGESSSMKKIDFRNPKGFAENEEVFDALRSMLRQAGYKNDFKVDGGLEAKGITAKISRMFSRLRLQRALSRLSCKKTWGLKSFPVFFYYLKPYLPKKTKVIGIYRNPWSVAESFMKAWEGGRYTFDQVIDIWTAANRDLLFHLSSFDSILISYDDLLDNEKSVIVFNKLAEFTGLKSDDMKKAIDPSLNRSSKPAEKMKGSLSLPNDVKGVLESLESIKAK